MPKLCEDRHPKGHNPDRCREQPNPCVHQCLEPLSVNGCRFSLPNPFRGGSGIDGLALGRASSRALLDPAPLGVDEFAQAEVRKLAAVSAFLDPADRKARVRGAEAIDEVAPGLQAAGEIALNMFDASANGIVNAHELVAVGKHCLHLEIWNHFRTSVQDLIACQDHAASITSLATDLPVRPS